MQTDQWLPGVCRERGLNLDFFRALKLLILQWWIPVMTGMARIFQKYETSRIYIYIERERERGR
jgi:hypothetical protein